MTVLDKLRSLLTEFGVEFEETRKPGVVVVFCTQGATKVSGYMDFYTGFYFTPDGKFSEMGAWE